MDKIESADKYFTVPADYKKDSIDLFVKNNKLWNTKIKEVYGSINLPIIESGRITSELLNISKENLSEYVKYGKSKGIDFNYLINANCLRNNEYTRKGQVQFLKNIDFLYSIGITKLTIAIPALIELINKYYPDIEITLSVINGIDNIFSAEYFTSLEGIKSVYVHENLHRDINQLKQVIKVCKKNNVEIGMVVNNNCLLNCPFRTYHYNYVSHAVDDSSYISPEYYGYKCTLLNIKDTKNVVKTPWVRPDDFQFYKDLGINKFKISGRENIKRNPNFVRVVETYNSNTYCGNLADLFMCFLDTAYSDIFYIDNNKDLDNYMALVKQGKVNCNRCNNCNKCDIVAKSIKVNEDKAKYWGDICNEKINLFEGNVKK